MLELSSAPNTEYIDNKLLHRLLNAYTSQTYLNYVSNVCIDATSEGTIKYCLQNLIYMKYFSCEIIFEKEKL
jgi:hypothetical protein